MSVAATQEYIPRCAERSSLQCTKIGMLVEYAVISYNGYYSTNRVANLRGNIECRQPSDGNCFELMFLKPIQP
jgi:hypothetical protein